MADQKYDKRYCGLLIEHMSKGYSYQSFSGVLGVNPSCVDQWEAKPEWLEAKKIAFSKCQLFWEKLGIDHVIGESTAGVGSKSLNASAWIFNMKNRFGWRDKQPEEVPTININVESLSDEELEKILKTYIKEKSKK